MYAIVDFVTKAPVQTNDFVFTGEANPWEVQMDLEQVKRQLNLDYFKLAPPCLAKYLPFMPIDSAADFISLQEGATPLLKSRTLGPELGIDLYFKVEGKNPTGSFKDRGSAVDISVAKAMGAKGVILASTGNMAASCCAYAAAAGLPCYVLVPEGVSTNKMAQAISYGGRVVQVKGDYNDAARLSEAIAREQGFFLAGDYAFRVEGQKTAAFELADQMAFHLPDCVILPIGCGTNMAAYHKGFAEYQTLGLTDRIPELWGVQASGAAPVTCNKSFQHANTLASAICVADPLDGAKAHHAIDHTHGMGVTVTDEALLAAQYQLAHREGLFVESASAATFASVLQQADRLQGKKVVCVLTGDGLKDSHVVMRSALKPPSINATTEAFNTLADQHYFDGNTMVFADRSQLLFEQAPSFEQVKQQAETLFNTQYNDTNVQQVQDHIGAILAKGKHITLADFQDVVQDMQQALATVHRHVHVEDFTVTTGKDKSARASVTVNVEGETHQADAIAAGPVDAVVNALCQACHKQLTFTLTDYHVEIRSQGVDALVYVALSLQADGHKSQGCATSPDIIQASIEAFEAAYRALPKTESRTPPCAA